MNARLILLGTMLAAAIIFAALINVLVPGMPPPTPPLSAGDVQEFRESLPGKPLPPTTPTVTNTVIPHSLSMKMVARGEI